MRYKSDLFSSKLSGVFSYEVIRELFANEVKLKISDKYSSELTKVSGAQLVFLSTRRHEKNIYLMISVKISLEVTS